MVAQFFSNPAPHSIRCDGPFLTLMLDNKGSDSLPVAFVWHTYDTDFANSWVRKKAILDFKRMDVLAALDYQILNTACDAHVSVSIHRCFVSSMHPHNALFIRHHDF